MHEDKFSLRLAQLRMKKGVSAREMSLQLGQNPGYINTIENGKAFPTMVNFFYMCEFLNISPSDFFNGEVENPKKLNELIDDLKQLDETQLDMIAALVKELLGKKRYG